MVTRGRKGAALSALLLVGDTETRNALRTRLAPLRCRTVDAPDGAAAHDALRRRGHDLAFIDAAGAPDLLPQLFAACPQLDVILLSPTSGGADGRLDDAVAAALRGGARDVLSASHSDAELRQVIDRTIARRALERQVIELRAQLARDVPEVDLETRSPRMRALLGVLGRAAAHDVPVLLRGDNGTGRSVLARRLHALSPRRAAPLVVAHCAAPSVDRLVAELFGQARAGLAGAAHDEPGRVEAAAGGTLYLDEVAELPPAVQDRLLRLLRDGSFERLGESRVRHADVRLVAATGRDLARAVAEGRFRAALLDALSTVELAVPSLAERREDIVPLARGFLAFYGRAIPGPPLELTELAADALLAWSWPGNVRELRNTIERAVLLATSTRVGLELLPERIAGTAAPAPQLGGDYTLEAIEREHTLRVLARAGSVDDAARILGVDAVTLWRRRKTYEER